MNTPNNKRYFKTNRTLNRNHTLPRQNMPVDTSQVFDRRFGNLFNLLRLNNHLQRIAIKNRLEILKISDSDMGVIVFVIAYKQRIHTVNIFEQMDNVVRITPSANGNDTVVTHSIRVTVALQEGTEFFFSLTPIKGKFFFMHSASAAYALVIKRDIE